MKRILALIIIMILGLFINGCTNSNEKVDIYTSIYPIEFLVKEIVKDQYGVKSIYPRGKDVHDYEPGPKDMIKMSNSKIIFYIGLNLEALIENSKDSTLANVPTVPLSANLTLVELNSDSIDSHSSNSDEGNIIYDPHVWLDPDKMQTMADTILQSLIQYLHLTEEQINFFTDNANTLKSQLQQLDADFFNVANSNLYANKTIMVDHDAYAYWEARYGIKRIRMRNDNESSDISPSEMEEKINLAKELGIKYICTTKNELESSIIDQYLRELNLTSDAKVQLHHLGTITSEEEKEGYNYFSLMRENLEVLKKVFPKK